MPNYSKKIVYLSKAQYQELIANNSVTVNGVTVTYNENDIYVTPQEEPITDIKINNTSIGNNGIANIPIGGNAGGSNTALGVVRGNAAGGVIIDDSTGEVMLSPASSNAIKAGTHNFKPISIAKQHEATFYGLAKVAGYDEKDSTEALGVYTDGAKSAIQNMLGITSLFANEEHSTASATHNVNSLFMMDGKLHRATAAIAIGDAVVVGTNCEVVKADEVFTKNTDIPVEYGTGIGSLQTKSFTYNNNVFSSTASGVGATAIGISTQASGAASHSEGESTIASGPMSHAEGIQTTASNAAAHAEGSGTTASGVYAHAEGNSTTASGLGSHSEGFDTTASNTGTHAEGFGSVASGYGSHAEGFDSVASGRASHVEGYLTIASGRATHAIGQYNVDLNAGTAADVKGTYVEIIGNGTADNARSNAYALDWNGNGHYNGYVYVGCNADSTSGTRLPHDVQVNGTSVVSNGIANIPLASTSAPGVMTVGFGLVTIDNTVQVSRAITANIKPGTEQLAFIRPSVQHASVFYGLAKAAGDTTQSQSDNAIGTYTDTAKTAIQTMLGAQAAIEVIRL